MPKKDFYAVGIGSSAGGLSALCEFFAHLSATTNAAFFLIPHLSRHYKSQLHLILANYTSMPIIQVVERTKIEPGTIFILVENTCMFLDNEDGFLAVRKRDDNDIINKAIDIFFESLARFKSRAIGIILSGVGEDGSKGICRIEDEGGIVLVQSPASSEFDGMPNATIFNDSPKKIGTPAQLAEHVAELFSD